MTCDICGTGFKSGKDILIHGCHICRKGFRSNNTEIYKLTRSKYCSLKLRQKLYMKYKIPLAYLETLV